LEDNVNTRNSTPSERRDAFLQEYSAEENIRRYMKKTAGHGISYLLEHDYGDIYLEVIDKYVPKTPTGNGLRILEFGCGAGMNLLYLVSVLERRGTPVDFACGTDFSAPLIKSAQLEAKEALTPTIAEKVKFCVAKNDSLLDDMTRELTVGRDALLGSFDLILGVNTIRYCHRLKNEAACAQQIRELLRDQGVCIVIDMNDKFPAFRSRFRDRMTKDKESYYLPSLDEYARPFEAAQFEILRKDNFCWIPHSASRPLTAVMRAMTPVLNGISRRRAMRSLVISRKSNGRHP
jgi:SAM-dependent methyltransferase